MASDLERSLKLPSPTLNALTAVSFIGIPGDYGFCLHYGLRDDLEE
jgi:hypothetical protein